MPANIYEEYFEWLFDLVCAQRYSKPIYRKLLMRLHDTEFRYSIPRDRNRAEDGEDLRYRFALEHNYDVPTTVSDLCALQAPTCAAMPSAPAPLSLPWWPV